MATVLASELETFPAKVVYDTVGAIGVDSETSLTIAAPRHLLIAPLAATTVVIEVKLDSSDTWTLYATDNTGILHTFAGRFNFVRVRRTVGTGDVHVSAQFGE